VQRTVHFVDLVARILCGISQQLKIGVVRDSGTQYACGFFHSVDFDDSGGLFLREALRLVRWFGYARL
jgi:hypothetical protein